MFLSHTFFAHFQNVYFWEFKLQVPLHIFERMCKSLQLYLLEQQEKTYVSE